MESGIRAILDMDRQACRMEDEAKAQRREAPAKVELHRKDLAAAYASGVEEAVAYAREDQAKRLKQEKAKLDARQAELLAAMAAQVEQQHDAWVAQLVRAVTEQE